MSKRNLGYLGFLGLVGLLDTTTGIDALYGLLGLFGLFGFFGLVERNFLPIERVTIRVKPEPLNEFEEMEPAENWIIATQEDFFMDERDRYSGIPHSLKGAFKAVHGDLYTLKFWQQLTARLKIWRDL